MIRGSLITSRWCLTRVFPPEVVDEILAECGRLERRHRLLPAPVVVYYVLGLALFSSSSYERASPRVKLRPNVNANGVGPRSRSD